MAVYPRNPDFSIRRVQDIDSGDSANVSEIMMGTHTGTHIDAPSHVISGGMTVDMLPLEMMNGKAKLFDMRGHDGITKELLTEREICGGDIVIFKTDNTDAFHADTILGDYVTLDYEAAEYLAEKKIKMVGIDYMTIERPRGKRITGKSVHNILLSNGILVVETLRLEGVAEGIYQMHCFPINIAGADGAPARVVLE